LGFVISHGHKTIPIKRFQDLFLQDLFIPFKIKMAFAFAVATAKASYRGKSFDEISGDVTFYLFVGFAHDG